MQLIVLRLCSFEIQFYKYKLLVLNFIIKIIKMIKIYSKLKYYLQLKRNYTKI